MKRIAGLTLIASSLLGCAAEPVRLEQERTYQVEWIGGRPLIDNSRLSVTFGEDQRAYGNAGCNHWFAHYSLDGERLSFGPPGNTRKRCAPALMEQEKRFLDALGKVQRWDISSQQQLRLWPTEGKPIRLWLENR
ncbi:META domain-containing protein [Pseudomonas sp. LRF_L74]|uniref:META domain-containing protein n=1 Tax=Pseudomonas sp. LRF_L74 TaxID=3369422 RepID=UPI003F5E27A1